MDIGVFIPIGNNGWLISKTSPQYMPSFELNKKIVQKAEHYGLDFALSMIKLRGFGGESEFWDHNLESFTLMAGLAAVTERIRLYASVAVLTIPPAIVARMASTIDSISNGRFGVNIVSGWAKDEYEQMGLWPGEQFFGYRYDYSTEYVQVMRDLWTKGSSDFKGKYFQMDDCKLSPRPQVPIKVVCAGQSPRGMEFGATYGDYNFTLGKGVNTPTAHAPTNEAMAEAAAKTGRDVGNYVLMMVIADETDEKAMAKWKLYNEGADLGAMAWMAGQADADPNADSDGTAKRISAPEGAINFNMGTLVGSYASVARMLDEAATVPATKGIMLTFDDFLIGVEQFGQHIQPLMKSRREKLKAVA
jgi:pyrimidine oxygenase